MTDAQKALAMIERAKARGRASAVSLTRLSNPGTYNPITGETEGASDPVTHTAFGVKIGYEQTDMNNLLIRTGDQQVYVPAVGFIRPLTNEHLTVGGKVCTVVSVEVVAPGDTDVLYVIQARGL